MYYSGYVTGNEGMKWSRFVYETFQIFYYIPDDKRQIQTLPSV